MTPRQKWTAFYTMLRKDIVRMFRIWVQTFLPSVITSVLYFTIFGSVLGSRIGQMQGVNYMTGDYSRGASGFWVENGVIQYPVEEITIAGNLAEMFKQIVAVGADTLIRGTKQTGSILLESMTVAGN